MAYNNLRGRPSGDGDGMPPVLTSVLPLHASGFGPLPGAPVDPLRSDCTLHGTGYEGVHTVRGARVNHHRGPEELWARSYAACPTMASIHDTRALLGNAQAVPHASRTGHGGSAPVCVNPLALAQETERINLGRGTGAYHLWNGGAVHPGHGVTLHSSPSQVQRDVAWSGHLAQQSERAAELAFRDYADATFAEAAQFRQG